MAMKIKPDLKPVHLTKSFFHYSKRIVIMPHWIGDGFALIHRSKLSPYSNALCDAPDEVVQTILGISDDATAFRRWPDESADAIIKPECVTTYRQTNLYIMTSRVYLCDKRPAIALINADFVDKLSPYFDLAKLSSSSTETLCTKPLVDETRMLFLMPAIFSNPRGDVNDVAALSAALGLYYKK